MVTAVPTVREDATIGEIEGLLVKTAANFESISYIYVIDEGRRLKGILSVKEVFRTPKGTRVSEVMERNVVSVRPHTEGERVALLAIEHNIKAMPVVDAEERFLGIYPSDAIFAILHKEHIEDLLKFAGIHRFTDPAKTILTASVGTLIKKRLPWLVVGLGGGLLAALVVSRFEKSLEEELLLAAFIPAVVYIADAVGTQTETLFIRSLSINRALNIKSYIWREMKTGVGIACILGILAAILTWAVIGAPLSFIIGISFVLTAIAAVVIALILPSLFRKLNIDPAIGSGPFATVITDIASLLIYFAIASILLTRVGGT